MKNTGSALGRDWMNFPTTAPAVSASWASSSTESWHSSGGVSPGQGDQHGPFRTFRQVVATGTFGQDLLHCMDYIAKGHSGHVLCLEGAEFLEYRLLAVIQVRNHPETQERLALGRFPGHGSHGVETQVPQGRQIHPAEPRCAGGMGVDAGNPAEPVLAPPGIRAGQFHMAVAAYGDRRLGLSGRPCGKSPG